MGAMIIHKVPCAKGAVCHGLDVISSGDGARARLKALRAAILGLAPSYDGLAEVFDRYLLRHAFRGEAARRRIVDHLKACWFGTASRASYFPRTPVARIYAEGVLRTLELSLKGRGRPVPIDAWWLLDHADVELVNVARVRRGVTVSPTVTLLIQTPRPTGKGGRPPWILGDSAEAYVTRRAGRRIATERVRAIR